MLFFSCLFFHDCVLIAIFWLALLRMMSHDRKVFKYVNIPGSFVKTIKNKYKS